MLISAGFSDHPVGTTFERAPGLPYWTASVLVRGGTRLQTAHGEIVNRAGCATLIAPDTPYRIRDDNRVKGWVAPWVIFDPDATQQRWMQWHEVLPGVRRMERDPGSSAFESLVNSWVMTRWWLAHKPPPLNQDGANLYFTQGLLAVCAHQSQHASRDARIDEVLEYMHRHPERTMSVADLARRVHLSVTHLAHLFRAFTGQSPMRYLEEVRLGHARDALLGTNKRIAAIAAEAGFSNAFHFSTRFRLRFGQSPRAYRKRPHKVT